MFDKNSFSSYSNLETDKILSVLIGAKNNFQINLHLDAFKQ